MQKRNKYQIMKNLSIDSARAELRYPCANALRMGRGCLEEAATSYTWPSGLSMPSGYVRMNAE